MLGGLFLVAVVVGLVAYVANARRLRLPAKLDTASGTAACASCGSYVATNGPVGACVRCETCGTYGKLDDAQQLAPIDADYVASSYAFSAFLPEAPRWPLCCALCNAPSTRSLPMSLTYRAEATMEEKMTTGAIVGLASLGTLEVRDQHVRVTERFNVPHCAAHDSGVQLVPAGVAFRSYAYFKKFIDVNRRTVG